MHFTDVGYDETNADALLLRYRRGIGIFAEDGADIEKESDTMSVNISTNLAWLSDLSLTQCPFADFCQIQSTETLFDHEESCCKPCYCDSTCGKSLECCLEQFDLYKEANTYNMQCVRPTITFLNVSRIRVPDYYMITECLDDLENMCMHKTVAEWGSFFPVYSKRKDKIFFNKHCAECNLVDDAEEWRLSLSCKVVSDTQLTVMRNLLMDALKGISCEIVFLPQDGAPVDKFVCVKNLINRCNVTGNWNNFDPVINEACKTVHAPVRDDYNDDFMYANIFCVICNTADYNPYRTCHKYEHQLKDPTFKSFSVMLDYNVVNTAEETEVKRTVQTVCGEFQVNHPFKVYFYLLYLGK